MDATTFNYSWYHHHNQNKSPTLWLDTLYLKSHPWAGEDLSLKIDVDDQTIWKSALEL